MKAVHELDAMKGIKPYMSNFNHSIDDGMEEMLKQFPGRVRSHHAGWNFYGEVWYENGKFYEQVWCYRQPIAEYTADTLKELMERVNDTHGWD